jgi:hypothetical protein
VTSRHLTAPHSLHAHLADPSAAVAEAHRALASGGVFLAAAADRVPTPIAVTKRAC